MAKKSKVAQAVEKIENAIKEEQQKPVKRAPPKQSRAQQDYAKYRNEKWVEFKKAGKTFKQMLSDSDYKKGWAEQKQKLVK